MDKIKILFLIHDLGHGGAEKVLVNLVNHMDKSRFSVTVIALFGGGVNEQFLQKEIHYQAIWKKAIPGNSRYMKLLSPERLHDLCVKEDYDVEVSYLEGPSARIISGCRNRNTRLVSWIHVEQHTMEQLAQSFRSFREAVECYHRFDRTICVSDYVKDDFCTILNYRKTCMVLYNTVESDAIREQSLEPVVEPMPADYFHIAAVGTVKESKGYKRLIRIIRNLKEKGYPVILYILGKGPLEEQMKRLVKEYRISDSVLFLGYQTNPYKYVAKCDLFVCASYSEGFSTAATEALIVGTPVCTVEVSGMKEMLGDHDEYGIVTENAEGALEEGIEKLIRNRELLDHYREQALIRGKMFHTASTVAAVENMFLSLIKE